MPKAFFDYLTFERQLSKHTITAYKTDLRQFCLFCEHNKIDNLLSVNTRVIRQWIIFLLGKMNNASSVHRKLSSLKAFYNFEIREGRINENPALYVTLPKKEKRLPHFLKSQETDIMFQSELFDDTFEGKRDMNIMHLFYLTGMRRQELIDINIKDIDFSRNVINVTGKRSKVRSIPLTDWMINQLKGFIIERNKITLPTEQALFTTLKGDRMYPKLVYRIVNKYISQLATLNKRSPHVLRHTFATQMLNSGADLNAIKELLGHANLSATEIYTHNTFQKLKQTYNQAHPRA
jgi:integrase/recombinase XerC